VGKQRAFFLSEWEILQKEHPERFTRTKKSTREKKPPKIYDCSLCKLDKGCRSPKIGRYGKGRKKILIVGLCPGSSEDKQGRPFVGSSGRMLSRALDLIGFNLDRDCVRTNIVQCYPGYDKRNRRDKDPTKDQIKCCRPNLEKDIEEVQPRMIICLGTEAMNAVLRTKNSYDFTAGMMHGKVLPYHRYNCWVGCSYHPAFFLHRKDKNDTPDDSAIFTYDLAKILNYLDEPLPQPLTSDGNNCITDPDDAVCALNDLCDIKEPVAFDYETNMLSPFHEGAEILSIALSKDTKSAVFIPLGLKGVFNLAEQGAILAAMRKFLKSTTPKIVQNYYMEELWSRRIIKQSMNNFIWDTMVTAHVLNCHPRTTGLDFQAFELTGHEYSDMVDKKNMGSMALEVLCDYNCWDARYTLMSYYRQKSLLECKGEEQLLKFNKFFTSCLLHLANLKDRGTKIDLDQLSEIESSFEAEIENSVRAVRSSSGVKKYEEGTGKEFDINSPVQIGKVLYDIYKVEKTAQRMTPSGRGSTSKKVLQEICDRTNDKEVETLITSLFKYRKATKVLERAAEYRRLVDPKGFIHPTFNLNIAASYRSSASDPNIQNVFKHDSEQKIFRKCIVPRPGRVLLEADYDGLEVRVIAMVSRDRELIRQIVEKEDTHRKWASKIYSTPPEKITKEQRFNGKNGFVFASFYGSVPDSIAHYEGFKGISLDHIREVQREFWEEYHWVKEWQNKTISEYKKQGYVELVTGARRPGPLSINQLYNTPIQGPAYHLTQDALNRIDEALIEAGTKTVVIDEIHDAIIFDADLDEIESVIELSEEIMTSERFEWQAGVPLSVSWEIGERNWYEMSEL